MNSGFLRMRIGSGRPHCIAGVAVGPELVALLDPRSRVRAVEGGWVGGAGRKVRAYGGASFLEEARAEVTTGMDAALGELWSVGRKIDARHSIPLYSYPRFVEVKPNGFAPIK